MFVLARRIYARDFLQQLLNEPNELTLHLIKMSTLARIGEGASTVIRYQAVLPRYHHYLLILAWLILQHHLGFF